MQIRENFPLSEYLWYKIGGKAKYFLEVTALEDIPRALEFIHAHNPNRIFVCGLGSNLIFTDDDFDGAVISIAKPDERRPLKLTADGILEVFAGDTLDTAIEFAFEHGLTGLEWAGGLPGTVGAGVRGNVGAFGGEIKDTLMSAEVIDYSVERVAPQVVLNEDLGFVYRGSIIKNHKKMIVTSATFALRRVDAEELANAKDTYENNRDYRRTNHPLEYPNCGSVFKNIKATDQVDAVLSVWPELRDQVQQKWHGKVSMGYIIRKLGLEGYRVGSAQVSEKHCNFIINLGEAKSQDVRSIISEIQDRCEQNFSFRPEVEVEIVE